MHYEAQYQFILGVLKKCGIRANTVRGDDGLRLPMSDAPPQSLETAEKNTVYSLSDRLGCKYLYFRLPETAQYLLVIGPYLEEPVSANTLLTLSEQLHMPPKGLSGLGAWFSAVPILPDSSPVHQMLEQFYETLWGVGGYKFKSSNLLNDASPLPEAKPSRQDSDPLWLSRLLEQRYEYENALMEAVSQGLLQKAERGFSRFSPEHLEERTSDSLRNTKNYGVIMNTLLRKAAEQGGVHPLFIDRISSDFAIRIEQLPRLSDAWALMKEMIRGYCLLVQNHATGRFSSLVQRAILLIDEDLSADLSLHTLAQQLNASASYLSTLFKKETGQTVTAFISHRRIRQAKYLLRSTALQIQTVAQHCGFPDVNYFSKTFKKLTGMTPKAYRCAE